MAPLAAGFWSSLPVIQGSPCWATWETVLRSHGKGENRGNKPTVLAGLAIWVQISTIFIKGAWHWQGQQGAGVLAPIWDGLEDGQHHHPADVMGCLSCSPFEQFGTSFSPQKCFHQNCRALGHLAFILSKASLSFLCGQRTTKQFGKRIHEHTYIHLHAQLMYLDTLLFPKKRWHFSVSFACQEVTLFCWGGNLPSCHATWPCHTAGSGLHFPQHLNKNTVQP